jgi:hypothetical protein
MVVRQHDDVDWRQTVELNAWRDPPAGTEELDGGGALAPDGINENVETCNLKQEAGVPDPRDRESLGCSAWYYKFRNGPSEDAGVRVGSARIAAPFDERPLEEVHEPMQFRGGPGVSETTFRTMVGRECIVLLSHFDNALIAS